MNNQSTRIHVVAAVIENTQNEVFISLRPQHAHQGGLWEFPGGKVDVGEEPFTALKRELYEELGINIQHAQRLIQVSHDYADKEVLLDVWRVTRFSGEPHGKEGQQCQWVKKKSLPQYDFPAANYPIIKAAILPSLYLITPEAKDIESSFLPTLELRLQNGIRLVQLRAKQLNEEKYFSLAREAMRLCEKYDAKLLLNYSPNYSSVQASPEINGKSNDFKNIGHGIHVTSAGLVGLSKRPVPKNKLFAASCHTLEDFQHAAKVDADFIMLSPVKTTTSHPEAKPIGWSEFQSMVSQVNIPVYALGGMTADDVDHACDCGAQGIAAISALWND